MSAAQATAELAVSTDDIDGILNQPVLEDRVQQYVETERVYSEVFREYDATNVDTRSIEIPVQQDRMENPTVVAEGAEFPRTREQYNLQTMTFQKFGFEVALTMESQADSQIDLVQDQVDKKADQMADDMNRRAFEHIKDAITGTVADGSSDGTMTYEDLLAGREDLLSSPDPYDPDLLIADVQASHDLQAGNNFLEASDMQGELRRSGQVGRVMGMDVVEDDSGLNLTGNGNPGALLVDTQEFGWEGTRTPVTTEEYPSRRTQEDIYRSYTRKGWLVTRPESGVIVEG